jgi:hypothetical protein
VKSAIFPRDIHRPAPAGIEIRGNNQLIPSAVDNFVLYCAKLLSELESPVIMSPSGTAPESPESRFGKFGDLNLSIIGLGVEYPPFLLGPECLNELVKRHYPASPA